jgi:hypothetical protein
MHPEAMWAAGHAVNLAGYYAGRPVAARPNADPVATAARFAEAAVNSALLRDVLGYPFRPAPAIAPAWLACNDGAVRQIAQAIYDDEAFDLLPLLADALEDAGCAEAEVLAHCRGPGEHVRGCWVVDWLLDKT